MENEKMFEMATRNKMRFPYKGEASVEDLWDLSVENLDSVYKVLNSEAKQVKEDSLLDTRTEENKELDLKIKIVKHIVQVKLDEKEMKLLAKGKREEKQKLMKILASKQDEELAGKSSEEIQKMIDEL